MATFPASAATTTFRESGAGALMTRVRPPSACVCRARNDDDLNPCAGHLEEGRLGCAEPLFDEPAREGLARRLERLVLERGRRRAEDLAELLVRGAEKRRDRSVDVPGGAHPAAEERVDFGVVDPLGGHRSLQGP